MSVGMVDELGCSGQNCFEMFVHKYLKPLMLENNYVFRFSIHIVVVKSRIFGSLKNFKRCFFGTQAPMTLVKLLFDWNVDSQKSIDQKYYQFQWKETGITQMIYLLI